MRFNYQWDWAAAERGFQQAIRLDPDYANAHHWYGDYLSALGRHQEAIAASERARRLDPLSPIINAWLGWRYYFAGDADRAIEQYRKTLEIEPNFAPAHLVLGQAYERKAMLEEATFESSAPPSCRKTSPCTSPRSRTPMRSRAGARRLNAGSAKLQGLARTRYVSPVQIAIVQAGLGRPREALGWLQKAYEERAPAIVWIRSYPRMEPLRSEAKYRELLARLRFP